MILFTHGVIDETGLREAFFIVFFSSFFASCISTVENISDNQRLIKETITKEKSLVFGNILWLENGKQTKIGSSIFEFYVKPDLVKLEDKTRVVCDVGENGDFVWALEPGTYVINKMQYRDTWSGNYFFVPQSAFRITESGKVYYVGQLEVNFEPERDLIGGLSGKATLSVNDLSANTDEKFSQRYDIPQENIEKRLMVHDRRLPTTFDTTAEFNIGLQLLNAIFLAM